MGVQVLLTNLSSSLLQSAETRKLIDLLTQKKLAFELVDGSAAESREKRNEMWEKSGKRSYPQVFLNGEFFGDLDTIQSLLDCDQFDATFKDHFIQEG